MTIKGIGRVAKKEVLAVFNNDVKKDIKDGVISMEEVAELYKEVLVRRASKIGAYGDTYAANRKRIPADVCDKLSPTEIAALVDAFYDCYSDVEMSFAIRGGKM